MFLICSINLITFSEILPAITSFVFKTSRAAGASCSISAIYSKVRSAPLLPWVQKKAAHLICVEYFFKNALTGLAMVKAQTGVPITTKP